MCFAADTPAFYSAFQFGERRGGLLIPHPMREAIGIAQKRQEKPFKHMFQIPVKGRFCEQEI
jgi:hypothetical protein